MTSVMPGWRILTMTSPPSCNWARCTWAIEAEASGVAGAFELVGQAEAAHAVGKAVANQHGGNFVQAAHVARGAQGL
jgi:hypothetical protein